MDSVIAVPGYLIKFSGTPAQVRKWILENDPQRLALIHDVLVGKTGKYVSIQNYLG